MSRQGRLSYSYPLPIPYMVSGSLGEYRGQHLHLGIDLRTYGINGIPVRPIADGYIEKLLGSNRGFGKAVYIRHYNQKRSQVCS